MARRYSDRSRQSTECYCEHTCNLINICDSFHYIKTFATLAALILYIYNYIIIYCIRFNFINISLFTLQKLKFRFKLTLISVCIQIFFPSIKNISKMTYNTFSCDQDMNSKTLNLLLVDAMKLFFREQLGVKLASLVRSSS